MRNLKNKIKNKNTKKMKSPRWGSLGRRPPGRTEGIFDTVAWNVVEGCLPLYCSWKCLAVHFSPKSHYRFEFWEVFGPLDLPFGNNCCMTCCVTLQEEITKVFTLCILCSRGVKDCFCVIIFCLLWILWLN